jgi:hypothetical protein
VYMRRDKASLLSVSQAAMALTGVPGVPSLVPEPDLRCDPTVSVSDTATAEEYESAPEVEGVPVGAFVWRR